MRWVLAVLVLTSCSYAITVPETPETPVTCHPYLIAVPVVDLAASVAATGVAIVLVAERDEHHLGDNAPGIWFFSGLLGSVAISYALGAGHGLHAVLSCPDSRRAHDAWLRQQKKLAQRKERDERKEAAQKTAWRLTQEAQAAARAGDCATAIRIGGDVAKLDAALHAAVYERDVAILRCKTVPEPAPP